jgi:hypothetical protein
MELSSISVEGIGAVSPAGWSVNSLRDALAKGQSMPITGLARPGWRRGLPVRQTPIPTPRPSFFGHARLRRASPITQFAVGAALEALGKEVGLVSSGQLRLGIILCVMAGCVGYSRRFYEEILSDPATASPLVFPETVFNAPASHLAAFLGSTARSYTLVGDPGMFLAGLALGAQWLMADAVDRALVIGAEEVDWLVADAFRRFERHAVLSEGAGALYLRRSSTTPSVRLERVTDSHSYLVTRPKRASAQAMRAQLPVSRPDYLLCEGTLGWTRYDAPEIEAWVDWLGPRLALKPLLGEGLAAGSAWQCVAAIDALQRKQVRGAVISAVGCNQQAIGACFCRE